MVINILDQVNGQRDIVQFYRFSNNSISLRHKNTHQIGHASSVQTNA